MSLEQQITDQVTTDLLERYYELREIHIAHGNIVAGAEDFARRGEYQAAVDWLKVAENSDFVTDKAALKAAVARFETARLEQQITALLTGLGDHYDTVANSLRARQVKGVQKDKCDCPVARLIRELPGVADVEVGHGKVTVYPAALGDDTVEVLLSTPVCNFVWLFDGGLYLDLVDDGAVA
jgi:hypothetical protein